MRVRLALILGFALTAQAQHSHWREVSTFDFQWKQNQPSYKFILEIPADWNDPGDFLKLRILPPNNGQEYTLVDSGGFVKISSELRNPKLEQRNLAKSEYLYFSPDMVQADKTPLLILFCWAYASSPGVIHILQLGVDGRPHEVFDGEFLITAFADLDRDGRKELIGKRWLSELWGKCYETYAPYFVYRHPRKRTSPLQCSLTLTEKYNMAHYYGWMGPEYSEKIVVVRCGPGERKPILMKLEDAEKILGK